MSDYSTSSHPDVTALRRNPGTGLVSGWACAKCAKPQFSQLGRGYRMYAGCKQLVCKGCKAEIDARRVKA
jgi:hypothetical protein